jgi:hypothetical protein
MGTVYWVHPELRVTGTGAWASTVHAGSADEVVGMFHSKAYAA